MRHFRNRKCLYNFFKYAIILKVSSRLELWGDELQRTEPPRDPQQAEQALAGHNESVARMQHATFQVNIYENIQRNLIKSLL